MTRTLPAAVATAIANNAAGTETLYWAILLQLGLDSGTVYMHSGVGDLSWNGQTWTGVGGMGTISGVPEDTGMSSTEIKVTLAHFAIGALPDFIVEFDTNDPTKRPWEMHLAFFDEDHVIKDVLTLDKGGIGGVIMSESEETGQIEVSLVNETARLERADGLRLTDQHQQSIWPGDKGLEFVTDTNLGDIPWGVTDNSIRRAPSTPSPFGNPFGGGFGRF